MCSLKTSSSENIENLIIIGSGPAGYTAAIYAARANLHPLLFTGFQVGGIAGGQLMTTTFVENFPGFPNGIRGPELMDLMKSQAIRWGTQLIEEDVDIIKLHKRPFSLKAAGKNYYSHSLIIATGAKANRLNLPHEEKFWSRGISACAICDGATPQFIGKELAVVGGGDSACEEAVYLTKFGSHVHLLVRSEKLKASAAMADKTIKNSQISVHWNTEIIDVEGNDWLTNVILKKRNTKEKTNLAVKGLFYAIGHKPNSELFEGQLKLDSHGYLITTPGRPETSTEGVFAAGDIADSEWRQGVTAAASGCKASLAAEKWLSENNLSELILRDSIEPSKTKNSEPTKPSSEINYNSNNLWQKGSYALRRLYHESNNPLFVIYTSPDCGPCHVLKPQIKRVIEEHKGLVQGVEIDIQLERNIAIQAGVESTPTIQLFNYKKLIRQWKGVKQRGEFHEAIRKILGEVTN